MKLFAVTIRDSAGDVYHAPIFVPALGLAERWFKDEVNNPQADMFKNPGDYELHHIGSYDNETAELTSETPRLLMRGIDVVRKPS